MALGVDDPIVAMVKAMYGLLEEEIQTPFELASMLCKIGVRGVRQNPLYCPVASYLHSTLGRGKIRVEHRETLIETPTGRISVHNPPVVTGFIEGFDAGEYDTVGSKPLAVPGWRCLYAVHDADA